MTTVQEPPAVDVDKLMSFVFRAVDEVGATLNTALVVMGDKLGFYTALSQAGPLTPSELAAKTGTSERYVREWLNAQAAGGYVEYQPDDGRYTLPPEQAVALTDASSPAYLPGFFQIALGSVLDSPRISEAARSGAGIGWHDHVHDVHEGCERFFRPGYNAHLVAEWLPALDGVVAKARAGSKGGRRGLRTWRVDRPDGSGVPRVHFRRVGLSRGIDRDGSYTGRGSGCCRSRDVRSRSGCVVPRKGL